MKNLLTLIFALVLITPGCTQKNTAGATYLVKRVVDGDTIELEDGRAVRYIGVDTPEIREKIQNRWVYNPQPYALEAREFNRTLVENKKIRLEFDVEKRDRYGRLLAYVYVDEKMVNLELLRAGYAMLYTSPPNIRHVEEFIAAQKEARENKRGFWGDLDKNRISYKAAKDFIGAFRAIEGKVRAVYFGKKVLILKFGKYKDDFKVVIFKKYLPLFFKRGIISPGDYYRNRKVRVFGLIKEYKGAPEIIVHDPSQLEIISD